jgi:hypothetical protein
VLTARYPLTKVAIAVVSVITLSLAGMQPHAQPGPAEHRLKAAFVYQFPQFVEWPARVWEGARSVELCVLRPNSSIAELEQLTRGESLKGRPLVVRPVDATDALDTCHVLFVADSASAAVEQILKDTASQPILTVGDSAGFLDQGGIIALKVVDRRVRFEIDMSRAQRAGLRISSQLLNLASAVRGGRL